MGGWGEHKEAAVSLFFTGPLASSAAKNQATHHHRWHLLRQTNGILVDSSIKHANYSITGSQVSNLLSEENCCIFL